MKAVCFGDLLLRLNPFGYECFTQASAFEAKYTGAEANVAFSLQTFGVETEFVTKVPTHEIGQAALDYMRKYGISVKNVVRGGDRLVLFYLKKGASQRSGNVIYDRANSAFTQAKREEFDWDKIFDGAAWFHLTGITPALSKELEEICLHALKKAKEKNITVSIDLNYRAKLWTKERAKDTLECFLPYVDYCKDLFWFSDESMDIEENANRMIKQFDMKGVAVTLRESRSANDHSFSGLFFTKGACYRSQKYDMHIVDRVGGGDAFSAAWIYALINGYTAQETIDFAVAASCLKHSVDGDFNFVTKEEVKNLMKGNVSGRVQR